MVPYKTTNSFALRSIVSCVVTAPGWFTPLG